jgi:hypothetical protein
MNTSHLALIYRVIDEQKADEQVSRRLNDKRRRRRSVSVPANAAYGNEVSEADDEEQDPDEDIEEIVGRYANHSEVFLPIARCLSFVSLFCSWRFSRFFH